VPARQLRARGEGTVAAAGLALGVGLAMRAHRVLTNELLRAYAYTCGDID